LGPQAEVIHLDTNFLIGVANRHQPVERAMVAWLQAGESFCASSIVWAEFLSGPVKQPEVRQMDVLIQGRVLPFGRADAEVASRLFNNTGRRRGSMPDCCIAAVAIRAGVPLATQNRKDFSLFAVDGLRIA